MKVEEAYKNLEKIICYGFLYKKVVIDDFVLVIKSITDREYNKILSTSISNDDITLISLAYCTAFINKINLFNNRDNNILKLVEYYKRVPFCFIDKLINIVKDTNELYLDSIEYLEGFSYSERSRYLWSVLDPYKRSSFVGIEGIDEVGLNDVIENWIHINKKLDEEKEYNKSLDLTLLIVGAYNYKAARSLSKSYETHRKELEELRAEICKYGYSRKREIENDKKREEWTAPLLTREDLVKELYRQASGYKDKHDLFIEEWIRRQKEKADKVRKEVEEKQKSYRNKIEKENKELEISRPVTEDELKKINELRNRLKRVGKRVIT
ncbi:MAG: hypothetical protein N2511_06900 [Thermodesulfovibrionales bacterium]|nr:hypothetical protein [Thermodesulfovibrionales bacterium]